MPPEPPPPPDAATGRLDGTGPDWRMFGNGATHWLSCVRIALEQSTKPGVEYSVEGVRVLPPTGPTWLLMLLEAVFAATVESDPDRLRAGLVRVGSTAADWIGAIDRRSTP